MLTRVVHTELLWQTRKYLKSKQRNLPLTVSKLPAGFLTFSAILDKVSLLEHQPVKARSYYIKQCLLRLFVFTVGAVVVEYGPNIKYAFCSHPGIQSCKKKF